MQFGVEERDDNNDFKFSRPSYSGVSHSLRFEAVQMMLPLKRNVATDKFKLSKLEH